MQSLSTHYAKNESVILQLKQKNLLGEGRGRSIGEVTAAVAGEAASPAVLSSGVAASAAERRVARTGDRVTSASVAED